MQLTEEQVTNVVEEYLETIYRLQEKEGGAAKTNDIVKSLKVVPGTVTNTVERLEKEGYVEHEPYRGVKLTKKGAKIALQVMRRHRLSERLLTDILHVDWSKAHDAACKIEHDIADEAIIENLEKALGNPKTCPHGNPIPNVAGSLAEEEEERREFTSLASLNASEKGTFVRVRDEDSETLRHLSELGLTPGVRIEVTGKDPAEGLVTVKLAGSAIHTISHSEASLVEVEVGKRRVKAAEEPKLKTTRTLSHVGSYGDYEH